MILCEHEYHFNPDCGVYVCVYCDHHKGNEGAMSVRPGTTYKPKRDDHMGKVLVRKCPRCGAEIGAPCVMKSGRPAIKVEYVHSARFKVTNGKAS